MRNKTTITEKIIYKNISYNKQTTIILSLLFFEVYSKTSFPVWLKYSNNNLYNAIYGLYVVVL